MIKDIFRIAAMKRTISEQQRSIDNLMYLVQVEVGNRDYELFEKERLRKVLLKIAKQETKTANATVKRMANMAREGLGK